jgi:hypothetical protein
MTIKSLYPASRPSLDLNFAKLKRLDPRITFTRASTGTYVGSDGLIKSAAVNEARFDHNPATGESLGLLVEESRINSLTYSNPTITTPWTSAGCSLIPNSGLAPDGTYTASKLIASTSSTADHFLVHDTSAGSNVATAFSIYVKAAGYTRIGFGRNATDGFNLGIISLTTGAVLAVSGAYSAAYAVDIGNGWWEIVLPFTSSTASNLRPRIIPIPDSLALGSDADTVWSGDGVSGVLVWGAQMEAGSFPTSHIPTPATFTSRTSTATFYDSTGTVQTAASGVARSAAFFPDSNGVMRPAGLLLEAAGTNLVTYSEQFDDASWSKTAATITANSIAGPSGSTTADTLTKTGSTGFVNSPTITVTSGVTHTMSVFIKAGTMTWAAIRTIAGFVDDYYYFDLSTGTVGTSSAAGHSIQKLGNGWHRCSVAATTTSTTCSFRIYGAAADENPGGTGDIYVWGAQLETGSYPTSYIPTVASTVTRSADVSSSATVTRSADVASITGANFSSWYNQSQWSLLSEISSIGGDPYIAEFQGSAANLITVNSRSNIKHLQVNSSSTISAAINAGLTPNDGTKYKLMVGVAADNYAATFSGNAPVVDLVGPMPAADMTLVTLFYSAFASTRSLNGRVSRLTYWPTRLPDATLQALTAS